MGFKNKIIEKEYKHQWYITNRDRLLIKRNKHYIDNKDTERAYDKKVKSTPKSKQYVKEYNKKYYSENKQQLIKYSVIYQRNYRKIRLKNDIYYRLAKRLRDRLRKAIKNNYKSGSAVSDLGCTIKYLKIHLEKQFKDGMSWDNYGYKTWHIDHIIPLDSFDLSIREQLLKAVHYTNLQPMWALDNIRKNKYITSRS